MAPGADLLPHIDEHAALVEADATSSWDALMVVVGRSMASGGARPFARLLGCADVDASGPRPLAAGSTIPGFHVDVAKPPRELSLLGSHRFSRYALIFRLDEVDGRRTRVRAETRAEFPGVHGRAYRALVIGSRAHAVLTRRLLDSIKRRAEGANGGAERP